MERAPGYPLRAKSERDAVRLRPEHSRLGIIREARGGTGGDHREPPPTVSGKTLARVTPGEEETPVQELRRQGPL